MGRLRPRSHTRPLGCRQEMPPRDIQIRQAAADEEPGGILRETAIPDFGPAKDPFDHQKRMLDFGPHLGLPPVLRPIGLTEGPVPTGFGVDETLGVGRVLTNHLRWPL